MMPHDGDGGKGNDRRNEGFRLRCAVRDAYLPGRGLKAVLMALVLRWPTIEATGAVLEVDAGVCRRTVVRALRELVRLGLVSRSSRRGRGGANSYELNLEAILALDRRKFEGLEGRL